MSSWGGGFPRANSNPFALTSTPLIGIGGYSNSGGTIVRVATTGANTAGIQGPDLLQVASAGFAFASGVNTFERLTVNSPTLLATQSGTAADATSRSLSVSEPGEWTVLSDPGAGNRPLLNRAAGTGNIRHICRSIIAACAQGASASGIITVVLRDGASGTGTIKLVFKIQVPTNDSRIVVLTGLNIVGSQATAMSAEFDVAPASPGQGSLTISGYSSA